MIEAYVEAFERFAANGGGKGPAWLLPARRAALDRFARTGFPTPKDEEWRFTPVAPIARTVWRTVDSAARRPTASELERFRFGTDWPTLVFVNGHFSPELSHRPALPGGATALPLAAALHEDGEALEPLLVRGALVEATPFTALNAAFLTDGALVRVPDRADLPDPIHLLYVATDEADGTITYPRNIVVVGRGARAQLVESYVALTGRVYVTNAVTEVWVGEGAWVEHSRIQRESEAAFHVGFTEVEQARDSHYRSFTLTMGAALARHNLHTRLGAENVEALLYGLYLTRGEQVADNHTAIFHDHPHCRSWEVYKGVLDGKSHAVFNGKVFVKPEAQKTDAKQTNRNLLLSEGARVNTKPQLEIFADDVKCTHGAAVGRLDELACFYLQARGIPRAAAQRLLTAAFAAEVVEEVSSAPVREALERLVYDRLGGGA